jgi:hypothetical protein
MTHEEAIRAQYKEHAGKILIRYMPIRDNNATYIIKVKEFNERLNELEDAIRKINAPGISDEYKGEIVSWAQNEYVSWAKTFLKK